MVILIPSSYAIIFPGFQGGPGKFSLAGRTTLEIFATIIIPCLVALNIQICCGCVLLAFVLGFGLNTVSVLYQV